MKFIDLEIVGENVPPAQYQAQELARGEAGFVMSRSELMTFADNPHKWLAGEHDEGTESTEWGDLIDVLLLIPDQTKSIYAVTPETYPSTGMKCPKCGSVTDSQSCRKCGVDRVKEKISKPWDFGATYCSAWREKQIASGKRVIKSVMFESAQRAVKEMEKNENAMSLINASKRQVMLTGHYEDSDTGLLIPVKLMLDLVPNKTHPRWGKSLADLKTCVSCNPPLFEKSIFNYEYDCQGSFYSDLYVQCTGEDRTDFVFVAQENKPPYEVADPLPLLSSSFRDIGKSKYLFALKYYARCLANGKFPSYSVGQRDVIDGRYIAEPRPWMVMDAVDRPELPPVEKSKTNPGEERPDLIP